MSIKSFTLAALVLIAPALASSAGAKDLTIGVVAPVEGHFSILGKQILAGATAAAKNAGDTILQVPETCNQDSGEEIAKRLISGGAQVAIGFLCSDSLYSALPAMKGAGIPAITLSARSRILFEDAAKNQWPFFSLAPAPDEQQDAVASFIEKNWSGTPFALLDDGTISDHELTANIRLELENKGIAPTLVDNFRPGLDNQKLLARRLAKLGITNAFIAGSRDDIAIIARDAADIADGMTIMGTESLFAATGDVPLTDGVLAAIPTLWLPHSQAEKVVEQLAKDNIVAEGYVLPAYAATEIASEAATVQKTGEDLSAAIAKGEFQTAIGRISFGPDHTRKESAYQFMEWRDGAFQPLADNTQGQ